jgi:hypothetical protein
LFRHEATADGVSNEVQIGDSLQDLLSGVLADLRFVVQDAGDRRDGDLRLISDVVDGGGCGFFAFQGISPFLISRVGFIISSKGPFLYSTQIKGFNKNHVFHPSAAPERSLHPRLPGMLPHHVPGDFSARPSGEALVSRLSFLEHDF